MNDTNQVIGNKIICFSCGGRFKVSGDNLTCQRCSRKYSIKGNFIEHDDLRFKEQYGLEYSEQARNYEKRHSLNEDFSNGMAFTMKKSMESFVSMPVTCALELGCGTGVLTRGANFHKIANFILATDISKEMLYEAARKDTNKNVIYLVQDATDLKVKDHSFDLVIGSAVLHHLTYLEKGLSEIYRVLNKNGLAIFQEPFYFGYQFLVFLINVVMENLKKSKEHSLDDLILLEKMIKSYSGNIAFRFENRNAPEMLAPYDDKHLFIREDLMNISKKVGFRNTEIISPWMVNPKINVKNWKEITIEVIEAIRNEAGLDSLKIDYATIQSLDLVDELIGNKLLDSIPPQGIIIFRK